MFKKGVFTNLLWDKVVSIGLLMRLKKLKNLMAFYFKNNNKDIIMTDEDEED